MINKVQKLVSMLLVCAVMFTSLGTMVCAENNTTYKEEEYALHHINPLYEDLLSEADLKKNLPDYCISTFTEPEYISDENVIAAIIREAMVKREETVVVYYTQVGTIREGILSDWMDLALADTGNPKEGDYLRYHYGGAKSQFLGRTYENDISEYAVTITITYYTTAEQETAVDDAVSETLANLGISQDMREYEIVKTIYDYICENITYDYENLNDQSYQLKYSAYAALINKTSVCQGYAALLYRMLREVGIETRVISGISYGEGHAWNIVKLGKQYYCLDATWDAGQKTYDYFLRGTDNFDNHVSDEKYTTSEFTSKYPISSTDFNKSEMMNPFDDLYDTDYYYRPVIWAVEEGITDGWTDTLFAPDMICTRGQVVTFLWRAAGQPKVTTSDHPFTDVAEDAYYYDAVLWAVEEGITDGWTETLFVPDMQCTRGQIVTFIWRAADEVNVTANTSRFTDVASNAYYYDAVLWAVENEITDGWTDTMFAPEMECTRGQIVTFLYRNYK